MSIVDRFLKRFQMKDEPTKFVIAGIYPDDELNTGSICVSDSDGKPFLTHGDAERWAKTHFPKQVDRILEVSTDAI